MSELRVLVGTADFDGATAFYGDVLGFPVQENCADPDGRGTLFRCASAAVIEIRDPSGLPLVFFTATGTP